MGLLLACGMAGLVSGCAVLLIGGGAAVGAGTVAYIRGELKATEEVSLNRVWSAALTAVKDLGFAEKEKSKDALSARLVARGADDKNITIRLKRKTDTITEIRIRVGTFGNESISRLILDKMKRHF